MIQSSGSSLSPWGKTESNTGARHHLAHHLMDVAAVFECLVRLPTIHSRLQLAAGGEVPVSALVGWAFLHDIGKLAPGFQAKGWNPSEFSGARLNHLDAGWDWLKSRGRPPFLPWIHPGSEWCLALMAHHGTPVGVTARTRTWKTSANYDWKRAEAKVLESLGKWCPDHNGALPKAPRLIHLAAGLLSLADWIGSDRRWFEFVEAFDPDYGQCARQRAATALSEIGLATDEWRPASTPDFRKLTGYQIPNAVQKAIAGISPEERLVILEAETGSGKTEAAVWRFARLLAEGQVDGLYFALPTRAAASQLQTRLSQMLRHWLGSATEVTLAVPGQLRVGDILGYRLPEWEVRWDEEIAHFWAAEHATRYLAAPMAVGTVDQAMMAALSVKHAPMRASSLSRNLLVVDEVHASDSFMTRIIHQLLEDHLALGGHALLMSATLGSSARTKLLGKAQPDQRAAVQSPYPAIWTSSGPTAAAGSRSRTISVETHCTMASEPLAGRAIDAARRGAKVLIIRNTVSAAQAVWQRILDSDPDCLLSVADGPALHHARFAAEDRLLLDRAVERDLGKQSALKGVVVIGTQTLEQALDIDADILMTDLCPADVLLQRLGRLHRHNRIRPSGFEQPRADILLPERGLSAFASPPYDYENGVGAWEDGGIQGIYTNLPALEATRRAIDGHSEWSIPEMNRDLVEAATHPEALAAIVAELGWEDYHYAIIAKELAEEQHGSYVVYSKARLFECFRPFPDDSAVRTRLGGDGVIYRLPEGTTGPFGTVIGRISLPAHWSRGLSGNEDVWIEGNDLAIDGKHFTYTRCGLSRTD